MTVSQLGHRSPVGVLTLSLEPLRGLQRSNPIAIALFSGLGQPQDDQLVIPILKRMKSTRACADCVGFSVEARRWSEVSIWS